MKNNLRIDYSKDLLDVVSYGIHMIPTEVIFRFTLKRKFYRIVYCTRDYQIYDVLMCVKYFKDLRRKSLTSNSVNPLPT